MSDDDEKYEKIGRTVATLAYWRFALRFILMSTAVSFIVLLIINRPLWLSPVIGVIIFLVYRMLRLTLFRFIFRLIDKANKK